MKKVKVSIERGSTVEATGGLHMYLLDNVKSEKPVYIHTLEAYRDGDLIGLDVEFLEGEDSSGDKIGFFSVIAKSDEDGEFYELKEVTHVEGLDVTVL